MDLEKSDSSCEKDKTVCSLNNQEDTQEVNASPQIESESFDTSRKQTTHFSGMNENTKHPIDCLNSISVPRNWSHIERLKSQRIKLQEKLSQTAQVRKSSEKEAAKQIKDFESVTNISDCPNAYNENCDLTEENDVYDVSSSGSDSEDQLIIADNEMDASNHVKPLNKNRENIVKPLSASKSVDDAIHLLEPKAIETRSSKSMGDCLPYENTEDLDLCELRASTINHSLYEAFANIDKDKTCVAETAKTKPKIQTFNKEQCYKVFKPEIDRDALPVDSDLRELKSFRDEKEKYFINKSFSDTNILCEETGRNKEMMKQKIKCFLQGKCKNKLLEKMFIKKMVGTKSILGKKNRDRKQKECSTSLALKQNPGKESDVDKDQIIESQLLTQESSNDQGLCKNIKGESSTNQTKDMVTYMPGESVNEMANGNEPNMSALQFATKNLKLQREIFSLELEKLKAEEEYIKMKSRLHDKQAVMRYFKKLENRCSTGETELPQSSTINLIKSQSCCYIHPGINDTNDDDDIPFSRKELDEGSCTSTLKKKETESIIDSKEKVEGMKNKSENNLNSIVASSSNKLTSPKACGQMPAIRIIESPKLSSIKAASPSSITMNMKSLLSKSMQKTDYTLKRCKYKPYIPDKIQKNPISADNYPKVLHDFKSSANQVNSFLNPKIIKQIPPRQQLCLVEHSTGKPMYAIVDKDCVPLRRVTGGVFSLPSHPGMGLQSCDSSVSAMPSVVYSGKPRPSLQSGKCPAVTTGKKHPPTSSETMSPGRMTASMNPLPSKDTLGLTAQVKLPMSQSTEPELMEISNDTQSDKPLRGSKNGDNVEVNSDKVQQASSPPSCADSEGVTNTSQASTFEKTHITKEHLKCSPPPTHQNESSKKVNKPPLLSDNESECVIDIDSESNDSFDSIDQDRYQRIKSCKEAENITHVSDEKLPPCSETGNKDDDASTCVTQHAAPAKGSSSEVDSFEHGTGESKDTTKTCSSENGATDIGKELSLLSPKHDNPAQRKFMKTKFIILKEKTQISQLLQELSDQGGICDKWIEVKKKAGFSKVQDPTFIHYLLTMEANRQANQDTGTEKLTTEIKKNVKCEEKCVDNILSEKNVVEKKEKVIQETQKTTKDQDKGDKVHKTRSDAAKTSETDKIHNTRADANKTSEKRHSRKRRAEKKNEEGQSIAKKAKPDSLSKTPRQFVTEQYKFLSKTAQKQMTWAVTVFKEWLRGQGGKSIHFEFYNTFWLNMKLEQFYREAHTLDSRTYSADNLQNIRRLLSLYLEGNPAANCVNISIPHDPGFSTSNQALADITRNYKTNPLTELPYSVLYKPPPSPMKKVDFELLYTSNTLSDIDPVSLLWKVWFDINYYLCSGQFTETFLRSLKKHSLNLQSDVDGVFYTFADDIALPPYDTLPKMYATPEAPDRCPVRTTTVYLSKLCENCDALFQNPKAKWESSDQWYLPTPVSAEKITTMMTCISAKAKLSKTYITGNVFATALQHRKNMSNNENHRN